MPKRKPGRGRPETRVQGKPKGAYHHGDLRKAMLAATNAVLEDFGIEGFTLRECARRAGVSHGAPSHHFGDVRGLLSAFTAESFDQMADLMQAYKAAAPQDDFAGLTAIGQAYVAYALANRARFQLMFRSDRLDFHNTELIRAAGRAYEQLVQQIADLNARETEGSSLVAEKTALAWSIVHGFATLCLDNAMFSSLIKGDPAKAVAMAGRLIELSRQGLESSLPPR